MTTPTCAMCPHPATIGAYCRPCLDREIEEHVSPDDLDAADLHYSRLLEAQKPNHRGLEPA